jgi:hypothetical protein
LRTATIQKELDTERAKQSRLSAETHQLKQQLQEAKNGLMAAARLSDQLELNQHTIERFNNESKFGAFLVSSSLGSVNFYRTSCLGHVFSSSFIFCDNASSRNPSRPDSRFITTATDSGTHKRARENLL